MGDHLCFSALPAKFSEDYIAPMFSGEFEHTMDDKGRVFLPAKHREELGESVFLWRGIEGQVMVYPREAWQAMAENLGQQNQARKAVRDVSRVLFAASESPLDRQGRIVIPPTLRKYSGLDTNVVILGMYNHLEIWSQERWQETTELVLQDGGMIAEQLAELGLKL